MSNGAPLAFDVPPDRPHDRADGQENEPSDNPNRHLPSERGQSVRSAR